MKKTFLLVLSVMTVALSQAQQATTNEPTREVKPAQAPHSKVNLQHTRHVKSGARLSMSMVYDYETALTDYDQGLTTNPVATQAIMMLPDTCFNIVTKDQPGTADTLWTFDAWGDRAYNGATNYNTITGMTFDPRSAVYSSSANSDYYQLTQYNPYTIDSVEIPYYYIRNTDATVMDTMLVQYIPNAAMKFKGGIGSVGPDPNYPDVAMPAYDKDRHIALGATVEQAFVLGEADTASVGNPYKTMVINKKMNATANNNGVSAVVWRYMPGTTYSKTEPFDSVGSASFNGNPIAKPFNEFYMVFNYDQTRFFNDNSGFASGSKLKVYQNGLFLLKSTRYGTVAPDSLWDGTIFPGTVIYTRNSGSERVPVFPTMRWHVTSDNIGVQELESRIFQVGDAYPSPAVDGIVRIPFQLAKAQQVSINLYDAAGRLVKVLTNGQCAAGIHGIDVELNSIPAGVYSYTFTAGGASVSKRLLVAN